jgi:hypothetical protein
MASDERQAEILGLAETAALMLVEGASADAICGPMLPHFLGMVTAFAMGYYGKMTDQRQMELPLLQYPCVAAGCAVAHTTTTAMITETRVGSC